MTCPSFHFPVPSMPREAEKRELFADYGIITGMCPITKDGEETKLLFQKKRSLACPMLCAAGPALPLLPPNDCLTTNEPCLSHLKESLEEVKQYTRVINHTGTRNTIKKLKNAKVEIFGLDAKNSRYRKTITHLAHITAKYSDNPYIPVVNTDYTGGCMSALQHSDTKYLCFPTGPQLDTLSLYELGTDGRPVLEHITSWKHRRIYQVDTSVINNSCFIGVRSEKSCRLFRLRDREEGIQFKRKMRLEFDSNPMSICMSPYIEGECVTLTVQGDLQLWDATRTAASQTGSVTQRFTDPAFWGHAAYSAHPRQLLVTDRTGVAVWDMRMSPRSEDVFVLPSMQLRSSDRVTAGRPHPTNPFYHLIATQETLLMLDHRFPKLPVLQWWHTLAAPPQYLNFALSAIPDRKEDVLLVSSQDHAETVCYQVSMSDPGLPPVSTSPPWRLAKPQDLFNLAGAPSLTEAAEAVKQRLDAPLVGVAAVNNSDQRGFSAIQITSYGDVFGQRYVIGAADMEKTWCSGPGSSHLKLNRKDAKTVSEWHQKLLPLCPGKSTKSPENNQQEPKKEKGQKTAGVAQKSRKAEKKTAHMPERLQRLLPNKDPDMCCKLCGDALHICSLDSSCASTRNKEQTPCPACRWTNDRSTSIYAAAISGRASPGTIDDETVDVLLNWTSFESDPERVTTAKSQLLIKLWEGQDLEDLMERRENERILQEEKIGIRRKSMEGVHRDADDAAANEADISDEENNDPSRNDNDSDIGVDEPDVALRGSELQDLSDHITPPTLSTEPHPRSQTLGAEPHPRSQTLAAEPHPQSQTLAAEPHPRSQTLAAEPHPRSQTLSAESHPQSHLQDSSGDSDVSLELECPDLNRTGTLPQTPVWKRPREAEEPQTREEGNQSKRRRVYLSSESDNISTPLTMFSQLYATPTPGKVSSTNAGKSPANATPSRTPKKRKEGAKFKSVIGF